MSGNAGWDEKKLHARCSHPDYEYAITQGPRKAFDHIDTPPDGDGWERNVDTGRDGWERFDYHEESYWRRPRPDRGAATALLREGREKTLRDGLMSAGLAAADEWLALRGHRRMSEVNRRRLVGHIVNALWDQIMDAALGIAHMINEDFEAEREQLQTEVETLRPPVMVLQVDADLSEEDVARLRARYAEAVAADPRPVWTVTSEEVRVVEWTLGDDYEPYDYRRIYDEGDARAFAADPDSTSVLWRREATQWRKAEAERPAPTANGA